MHVKEQHTNTWLCYGVSHHGQIDIMSGTYTEGQSVAVKWGRIKKGWGTRGTVIEDTPFRKTLKVESDSWTHIVLQRITFPAIVEVLNHETQ